MSKNGKQELRYTSLDELKEKFKFDTKRIDYSKISMCNSLLKTKDEGMSYLKRGDDENAFGLLMRFVECSIELRRKSKNNIEFVDKLITQKILKETIDLLEKLSSDLKTRYELKKELSPPPTKNTTSPVQKEVDVAKQSSSSQLNSDISALNKIETGPKELVDLINKTELKILIIDTRAKAEFNNSQLSLNILLGNNRKRQEQISYINIPDEYIENVSWKINENLKNVDSKTARIFSSRDQYDHLILFDKSSTGKRLMPSSKLCMLKRALFEYDQETRLKSEPCILDGGFENWLLLYPGYTTNAATSTLSLTSPKADSSTNDSLKKLIDIDFPELEIKPKQVKQPDATSRNSVENDRENNGPETREESMEKEEKSSERHHPDNKTPQMPTFDRLNKPSITRQETAAKENDLIEQKYDAKIQIKNEDQENQIKKEPVIQMPHLPPNQNIGIAPMPKKIVNINKASLASHLPDSNENKLTNIINSVYLPASRGLKPIHTPFMHDGDSKILDAKTGLFSLVSGNLPAQSNVQATQESNFEAPVFKKPVQNSSSTASSLKRTISSPNIAKLAQIDAENNPPNLKTNNKPNLIIPSINRSSKPLAENAIRFRLEDLQPIYGNVRPGLTGIRNLGNTCFMNSILQCLMSTKKLVGYFLNEQYKQDLNRENSLGFRGQIADEFGLIVQAMWAGHCKVISPRRFKALIGQSYEQFLSNDQQDAQEFLLFLLDGLHEDLNRILKRPKAVNKEEENEDASVSDKEAAAFAWATHLSINNSIIVDLFQGQFRSTVTCLTCNKKSVKFDAFMYLTLPLPSNKCNIYQCIDLFLQPERMEGESKWKCPRCKAYRDAAKKIDIWKLPQILIIQLKRFKYQGIWRDKINTLVDFPIENLNLDRYALTTNNNNNYKLYAMSNHSGTMDGGHYTAMCRHFQLDRWFRFDDKDVKEMNDTSGLVSPMSYILFYAR